MPFANPGLFAMGAGAASVPVIIHLLNRRRYKIIEWAAMRFLRESVRRNRRRIQLEELILLALRCLAIFLLAVAVGRFVGCAPTPASVVASRAQMTHVFVLDDSVSMGQKLANTTSFSKAANDLAEMLNHVSSADRVAVLLTSRPKRSEALVDLGTLSDPEGLGDRLKALKPSDTRGQTVQTLETARELFRLVPGKTEKRLYVLSDFRRTDYAAPDFSERVRTELRGLRDENVGVVLLNYGSDPSSNLTIAEIKVLNKLTLVSQPVRVQVRVRNNGRSPAEHVAVGFVIRDTGGLEARLPAKTIRSIELGQSQLVQISFDMPEAGAAAVEAHLPGDTLAGDNVGFLGVEVREARRVLVVDGERERADPTLWESYYLVMALDPNADHGYGNEVKAVSMRRLAEEDFANYELVILANVGDFPLTPDADGRMGYGPLKALEQYVASGGGLAIFTGKQVNPTFYNGRFYNNGEGLCPLRVNPPIEDARSRIKFVRLLRDGISSDPVMGVFQGNRAQFTRFVRFYGYTPAEPAPPMASPKLGPVRVLARFDNKQTTPHHSPAMVVRKYGRGSVMMICSTADIEWTDWPKDLTFLPFINDMAEYLSRPAAAEFTDRVGRRIHYSLRPEMAAAWAELQLPGLAEDLISLTDPRKGPQRFVSYEDTRRAGIYQLNLSLGDQKRTVLFARNVDPIEGRLERAGEQELRAWLGGVEFEYQDKLAPAAAESPLSSGRSEYWKAALAAMLMVLAVEVFLGQRFGHYR